MTFWRKKAEIEIKTHCEFLPDDAWDMIPVCRDLKKMESR